eukprot:883934-Amphidinium_carterae.1
MESRLQRSLVDQQGSIRTRQQLLTGSLYIFLQSSLQRRHTSDLSVYLNDRSRVGNLTSNQDG